MASWIYNFDEEITLSANVEKFLNLLKFDSLRFITVDPFIPVSSVEEAIKKEYAVTSVSVIGSVGYIKKNLSESFNQLKDQIGKYIGSEEPYDEKLYQLSKARINVKEFLYSINFNDPVMVDLKMHVKLYNNNTNEEIEIFWSQAKLSSEATQEIYDHLHLRNTYVGMLDSLCSLEIEKLNFSLVRVVEPDIVRDKKKEIDLLEVWIALSLTGYLNHLKNDDQRSLHRKAFFELFELYDDDYKNRRQVIIKRNDSARLTPVMVEAINNMHDVKVVKKKARKSSIAKTTSRAV